MTTHEPILARLAALKAMSVNELKAEWQELFAAPAPTTVVPSLRAGWPIASKS